MVNSMREKRASCSWRRRTCRASVRFPCHLNELEFYSDAALAFAREKAERVRAMEAVLDDVKKAAFAAA